MSQKEFSFPFSHLNFSCCFNVNKLFIMVTMFSFPFPLPPPILFSAPKQDVYFSSVRKESPFSPSLACAFHVQMLGRVLGKELHIFSPPSGPNVLY